MVQFRKTATLEEFSMDISVDLVAGKYIELMSMKVPAQQIRFWGNGSIINGVDDRGIFKLSVADANGNEIKGTARLVVSDANKVNRNFRREDRTEDLSTNGVKVGKDVVGAGEDSYLIVEFKPDASATADKAHTSVFAPITVRTK